jgi:hypothetical protein
MPDNWSFVVAAYAVAAIALGGYWRFLGRRERELRRLASGSPDPRRPRGARGAGADATHPTTSRRAAT